MITARGTRSTPVAMERATAKGVAWLAALSLGGLSFFCASAVTLHLLRTDYDPAAETVSQLTLGPYGYLLTSAFFVLGPGVVALAVALFLGVTNPGRIGPALLAAGGISVFFAGIFPTNQGLEPRTVAEMVHDALSVTSFLGANAAMFILAGQFKHDDRWRPFHRPTLVLACAAAVGFLGFVTTSEAPIIGIGERIAIAAMFLWLVAVAVRLWILAATVTPALEQPSLLRQGRLVPRGADGPSQLSPAPESYPTSPPREPGPTGVPPPSHD